MSAFVFQSGSEITWTRVWADKGTGSKCAKGSGWIATPPVGYVNVGGSWNNASSDAPGREVVFVKDDPNLCRAPSGFDLLWNDNKSGSKMNVSVWKMNPPRGYVALGSAIVAGYNKPNLNDYRCVRDQFITFVKRDLPFIWSDRGCGSERDGRFVSNSEYHTVLTNPEPNVGYWQFIVRTELLDEFWAALDAPKKNGGSLSSQCCTDGYLDPVRDEAKLAVCRVLGLRDAQGGQTSKCSNSLAGFCQGANLESKQCQTFCSQNFDSCKTAIGDYCEAQYKKGGEHAVAAFKSKVCACNLPSEAYAPLSESVEKALGMKVGLNPMCLNKECAVAGAIRSDKMTCKQNIKVCSQIIKTEVGGSRSGTDNISATMDCGKGTSDVDGGDENESVQASLGSPDQEEAQDAEEEAQDAEAEGEDAEEEAQDAEEEGEDAEEETEDAEEEGEDQRRASSARMRSNGQPSPCNVPRAVPRQCAPRKKHICNSHSRTAQEPTLWGSDWWLFVLFGMLLFVALGWFAVHSMKKRAKQQQQQQQQEDSSRFKAVAASPVSTLSAADRVASIFRTSRDEKKQD